MTKPKTTYVVIWWTYQTPYAATFTNRIAAEAAANVRNALMLTVSGEIKEIVDWKYRNEKGEPMPAELRELTGRVPTTWWRPPT